MEAQGQRLGREEREAVLWSPRCCPPPSRGSGPFPLDWTEVCQLLAERAYSYLLAVPALF